MMASLSKRSQLMSFDFTTGIFIFVVIFLIFLGVFGITRLMEKDSKAFDLEMEYLFDNLENNLRSDTADPYGERAFLSTYRIDSARLAAFAGYWRSHPDMDFDSYVVGAIGTAHGIGLEPDGYDTCFYLKDDLGMIEPVEELSALGRVFDKETGTYVACDEKLKMNQNPCEGYTDVMALFAPVLYDTGDTSSNKIVQMNLVVCKV